MSAAPRVPSPAAPWRPTPAEIAAAVDRVIPDVVAPGLRVLFCGINPGLYSGAVGHHFARPGNRFWPTLHAAGFTPRLFSPFEDASLLALGLGVTNLVERTTATAAELGRDELERGGRRLAAKLRRLRPQWIAPLGLAAYRTAFGRAKAVVGPQAETVGHTRIWLLPNPSGLNASWQPPDLARAFGELAREVGMAV